MVLLLVAAHNSPDACSLCGCTRSDESIGSALLLERPSRGTASFFCSSSSEPRGGVRNSVMKSTFSELSGMPLLLPPPPPPLGGFLEVWRAVNLTNWTRDGVPLATPGVTRLPWASLCRAPPRFSGDLSNTHNIQTHICTSSCLPSNNFSGYSIAVKRNE